MAERWHDEPWAKNMWWSGKTTRRKFLGLSATAAGALGATMLVPAPWREAFGQAKPYKVGVLQPLTGTAAAGGKTALVGTQLATDRINKAGGINGRPIELIVADYESKPDVGRRKAEKMAVEDNIDAHVGGVLSNVCLACMPVWEEYKIVNMVGVCLDTTMATNKCKSAADGALAESTNLPALGAKIDGFAGINRYLPLLEPPLNTPAHKKFFDDAVARLKQVDPSATLPDRYVQSNFEAMNALKLGIEKSGFRGREDTPKLIEALEGLELKEGDDFPPGDKTLRKEDHQAFLREFIFEIKGGKHRIVSVVPKEKTMFPPACKFA